MKHRLFKSTIMGMVIGMVFFAASMFAGSAATQVPVEQQILQISASASIQTIYNSAISSDSRITILGYLPSVINRFNVNPTLSTPTWLSAILTQSLNSSNADEANAAISQIGNLKVTSLATNLIAMYGKSNDINLHIRLVKALGDMGSQNSISLLQSIIDAQVVSPVTDQAIISARKICASGLVPDISAYCTNLNSQIQSGAFSDTINRPLMDPDVSLMDAKGSLQALVNGACGQ